MAEGLLLSLRIWVSQVRESLSSGASHPCCLGGPEMPSGANPNHNELMGVMTDRQMGFSQLFLSQEVTSQASDPVNA